MPSAYNSSAGPTSSKIEVLLFAHARETTTTERRQATMGLLLDTDAFRRESRRGPVFGSRPAKAQSQATGAAGDCQFATVCVRIGSEIMMNKESLDKLRFDRRLRHRRGWVNEDVYSKEIDSLADASDKVAPPDEDHEADGAMATGSPNDEV